MVNILKSIVGCRGRRCWSFSSPKMPPAIRASFEARIASGERVGAPDIKRARRATAASISIKMAA
jgi:hypothetical protein